MELNALTAVSPIDGRYRSKAEALASYFSEYALIKYRVRVEIEYFITLCELPLPQLEKFDKSLFERLRDIYRNFSEGVFLFGCHLCFCFGCLVCLSCEVQ